MAANHETGVLQPITEAARQAAAVGAWLHCDATQAVGRVQLDFDGVHSIVLSGHKLGGPPGIGALVLPDGEDFPALFPGSQERGRRGGTVPTALVAGLGAACRLAADGLASREARWTALRARFEQAVVAWGGRVVGAGASRVANTSCVVFDDIEGETLVQALDLRGICVSSGAACTSGSTEPSATLLAMGDPHPTGGLRVSWGPHPREDDLDALLGALEASVEALRLAASWG
jgi:cysteine desulfurase